MEFPILKELARELAPLLAPLVAAEMRGSGDGWVSQRETKLGRNNHIEAVRRIQSEDGNSTRAVSRGKLHLLRKDVYDQELARASKIRCPMAKPRSVPVTDREEHWRQRLGVKRG